MAGVVNPLSNPGAGGVSPNNLAFYGGSAGPAPAFGQTQHQGFQQAGFGVQPPQPAGGGFQPVQPPTQAQQPGSGFAPQPQATTNQQRPSYDPDDFENEPPLLEELGINVEHIWQRIQGIAFFKRVNEDALSDADLSGPIAIGLALGVCLTCQGKMEFGQIYGMSGVGCCFICMLINVMAQKRRDGQQGIDFYSTLSILGYGLIPIVFLAFIGIFLDLKTQHGTILSGIVIFWATAMTSRFFSTAIGMQQQRWLVAYPVGLVYACFVIMTVF
jgi:hypothetical protein